ncbi:type I polyketide synthase [Actinacidiphila acididurans]|uniref:SDR family NAD(P)-dependent oxidoreductase n=1 Tax=Actinacidiphila acididurans TaxID=2784346 RepID=A0ABS2U6Q8_9ACTN|nr:type I polyketide synthase [Actinacidiphila acididurans]MBM9510200.1 SDR family NAD(P)-dependent oxidoreductase [Actinacidiphila acididurans]
MTADRPRGPGPEAGRRPPDHGATGTAALLRRLIAQACGRTPEEIETDRPLVDYGLSSRDAVGISGELEEVLGRTVPATLLWDHPTLDELLRHLDGDTESGSVPGPESGAAPRSSRPPDDADPVAVVGIGCRLPGGISGPRAFWDFLLGGGDAIGEVPERRWQDCGPEIAAAAARFPRTVRFGGYLPDVAGFDAQFFGITPREAQLMDPQQRLLLEVAWEALDHAGMPAPTLQGSPTGVYVGLSALEYGFLTTRPDRVTEWTGTGSAGSIVANRVSYALDLRGPSLTVDTACSSSLVALHQACRDLAAGACDTALAAGVNVLLSPAVTLGFHRAGVLAPGGRCRPFDAGAEGIVRGEGCGVVVLKRLSDALREELPVLALVRGSAVNSDGRSAGLVAPSQSGQQAVLRAALRDSGVPAGEIDYVETHGTGTLLGDPIEAAALSAVLGPDRGPGRPLLIGSVKSNVGHLEGAAGIVSVIKTVLALRHRTLPATLHYRAPNPHIDFAAGRLRVVGAPVPWPSDGDRPARAGVSAFGFGGTNAHAVLEQWVPARSGAAGAPQPAAMAAGDPSGAGDARTSSPAGASGDGRARESAPTAASGDTAVRTSGSHAPARAPARAAAHGNAPAADPETAATPRILVVSARSADRIAEAAADLADWLSGPEAAGTPLEDLTRTLAEQRYGPVGAAVVGRDRTALAAGLRALGAGRAAKGVVPAHPAAARGEQAPPGPVFVFSGYGAQWEGMGRRLLAEEPAFARAVAELDPLFDAMAGTSLTGLITDGVPLTDVARVQPALFGIQTALVHTWRAYGVEPAAVVGHSMGEAAAAVAAGALSAEDGLRVVVRRSELLGSVDARKAGAMAAVELPTEERAALLGRFHDVEVAVDASPRRCTLTGPAAAVEALLAELDRRGGFGRLLEVAGAGHSPAVDPVLPALRAALDGLRHRPPDVPWYGTVHKDPRRAPLAAAAYWCDNARRPVRLRQAVAAAAADGHRVFVEISPHPVASLPVRETLDGSADGGHLVLPSGRRDSDEPLVLHTTLAALHLAGVQRSPRLLWPTGRRTSLPSRTWRHTRHWVDGTDRPAARPQDHPVLGTRLDVPGTRRTLWRGEAPTGGDRAGGPARPALTLAGCALLALAAAAEAFGLTEDEIEVRDLALDRLAPLDDGAAVVTMLDPSGPGTAAVSVHSQSAVGTWRRHAGGAVRVAGPVTGHAGPDGAPYPVDLPAPGAPDEPSGTGLPGPALLEAVLGAPATALRAEPGGTPDGEGPAVPVALTSLRLTARAGAPGACRGRPSPGGGWSVRLEDTSGAVAVEAEDVVLRAPAAAETAPPLRECAYDLAWEDAPLGPAGSPAPASWLLLDGGADAGRAAAIEAALEEADRHVTVVRCAPDAVRTTVGAWRRDRPDPADGVVVLLLAGLPARTGVLTAVRAAQELAAADGPAPRLFLATDRARVVTAGDVPDPDQGSLRGLLRVLALEQPQLRTRLVDTDGSPDAVAGLARDLLTGADDDETAWRGGTRYAGRLVRAAVDTGTAVPFVRPGAAYIVTGGLTGLGLATAGRLAERGAGRVVLNGRRPPGGSTEQAVGALRALGTDVAVVLGDIAAPGTAARLVEAATAGGRALRGVAHAAGVLRDGTIGAVGPDDLDAALRPKADGARHLDEATAGHDLDWWLAFGSAAALLGSPGQAAYAVANAWLDALIERRRARGLPGQTIAWGPWAGIGAAPDMTALAVAPIVRDDGLDLLELLVRSGRTRTGVVRLDARRVTDAFPGIAAVPFFAPALTGPGGPDGADDALRAVVPTPDDLRALGPDAALAAVREPLLRRAAAIMGFAGQDFDTTVPLTDTGLDSLMAVRIRNAVKNDFGTDLPDTLLLRGGSLDDVAAALLAALSPAAAPPGGAAAGTESPARDRTAVPASVSAAPAGEGKAVRSDGELSLAAAGPVPPPDLDRAAPCPDGSGPDGDRHRPPDTHENTPFPAGPGGDPPLPGHVLPRDAAERLVAGVWTQISGQQARGVHQELPGAREDPTVAARMVARLRARLGGERRILTAQQIREHPTVAAVADLVRPLMEGGRVAGSLRVLRPARGGTGPAPLFVFHPAGGSTSVYQPLADVLGPRWPVLGLDRVEALTSVEDKAAHSVRLIRRAQPRGPYRLLGWSFGGCLAYETAARLREAGESVEYLGLIDTILPAALPQIDERELLLQRFRRFAEYVGTAYGRRLDLPYEEMAELDDQGQTDVLMRHVAAAGLEMSPGVMEHQRTSYLDARIGERYRPRPWPDPVVLYRARQPQALTTAIDPRYLRDDEDLGWGPLCPRLTVVPVPGDHLSLIDPPHVDVIARHLRAALDGQGHPDRKEGP